uniref:Protease 3 n=1 Tax=Candidatus Kentrum sp. FW TaxID=2126338 RepID=A0A450SPD5_9GAMM|nr:MAG: Secreted Zn-dependent peptidases, insulinase-like [Candidatus Kentron sp. FW]
MSDSNLFPLSRRWIPTILVGCYHSFRAIVFPVLVLLMAQSAWCSAAVITSPSDTRQYAALELPNRLKVLLISDPKTDKAACGLDVLVGSNVDPEARPGLAHFLEHMLFLGTRKYPEPDAFQAFITKHAGEQNAYTDFAHTNYFFDVDKEYLREALDRFGQFFIAPIFAGVYVDRERSVVDAEFHSKKKNDTWRKMETIKRAMNPEHPLSRFTIGNLATLSDRTELKGNPVREDLIALYRRYYSANLMALVVLGKEPLHVLRQWVTAVFSAVPDRKAKPPRITDPLFAPGQLPTRMVLGPVQERRELELLFPVPPLRPHYKTKPLYYISHIIGHEGKGSLLSLLKERGWAEALSAGTLHDHEDGATFGISITLTRKGMENTDAITALVFQTIRLIEEQGVHEWLFRELAQLAEMEFLFQEKSLPTDYVSDLANALHEYPLPDVLRGPIMVEHYDEELLHRYLQALRPDNVLILVVDPDVRETATPGTDTAWLEVPCFGARYRQEPMDPELLDKWQGASVFASIPAPGASPGDSPITIPSPNIFIPRDLSLKHVTHPGRPLAISDFARVRKGKPTPIIHTPGLTVWFRQDTTYRTPRADFYFSVRSPVANDTPTHSVMTDLLVALVEDELTEFSYPASLAGLDYDLYRHVRGLSVRISGYHDKQKLLLRAIVEALYRAKFDPERFGSTKLELIRKLRNTRKEVPYRRALSELRNLLVQPHYPPEVRIKALEPVTLADLRAFAPEFFQRLSLVALSHGNLHAPDALEMAAPLKARLIRDALPTKVPHGQITKLTKGVSHIRSIPLDHNDSVAIVYSQGQRRGFRGLARMALLEQILKDPFFHQLRTEAELGYVVLANAYPILQVPGILFLVQSPHTHPADLTRHITQFLAGGAEILADMNEAAFARHKAALITRVLTQEENLEARSDRYWREIDRELYTFDSRERKADAIGAITLPEIRQWYRAQILGKEKRQLIVQGVGNRQEWQSVRDDTVLEIHAVTIKDPARFKQEQDVFAGED